jgi:UDP-N-acetylmuramate dehydrogenase
MEVAMTNLEAVKREALLQEAEVLENEPMNRHTSFKIGGKSDLFISPAGVQAIEPIIRACRKFEVPYFILGNGSNILMSDSGFRGAIISFNSNISKISVNDDVITCEAGAKLVTVCMAAQKCCLKGLEFAYGIPGTMGGAVYMNAGAYGGEMKDVVTNSDYIDLSGRQTVNGSQHDFSYRHSLYSSSDKIITSVTLKLFQGSSKAISDKMNELMQKRKDRQPLEYPSAGSVFKRPEGHYAGTLIDNCCLKGTKIGGAMVSEKHAGFIINTGNATCDDVLKLIDLIKNSVFTQTGILLESEIKIVG